MKSCVERHLDLACTRLQKQENTIKEQQRKMVEQETKMAKQETKMIEQGRVLEEAVKRIRSLEAFESERTQTVYEGALGEEDLESLKCEGMASNASFYLRGYNMKLIFKGRVCFDPYYGILTDGISIGLDVIVGKYDHQVKWPFRSKVMISFPDAKRRDPGESFEVCIASPSEDKGPRFVDSGYLLEGLAPPCRFVFELSGGE